MRIALCLSGQPRLLEEQFPFIKSAILDYGGVDVFAHAWYNPENAGNHYEHALWHKSFPGRTGGIEKFGVDKAILDLYNPVSYVIEPQVDFTKQAKTCMSLVHARGGCLYSDSYKVFTCPLSMFYSMYKVCNIKKSYEEAGGFVYDVVVRSRFDMHIPKPIPFNSLDYSVISTPLTIWTPRGGACDLLGVGTSPNMDIYCGVYPNFESLCETADMSLPEPWGTEFLLAQHLNKHSIRISPCIPGSNANP